MSQKLGQISPIMAASQIVQKFSSEQRKSNLSVVSEFRKLRKALADQAISIGLRVKSFGTDQAINDIFEIDDTGRMIETFFKVVVQDSLEAKKLVDFCSKNDLGILPIGAKTSAIGLFEVHTHALRIGLKGVVGVYLQRSEVKLVGGSDSAFEAIYSEDKSIMVLKSKTSKQKHKVIAHSAVTVSEVNDFLNQTLDSSNVYYRIMPDPTSMAEAQLGGIISTGAQGGNRTNAAHDIRRVWLINADGVESCVEGDEAKNLVGLNGCAGLVVQAEFEVSAFPKYEHGLFIPVGKIADESTKRWRDLFSVQELLRPFCQDTTDAVQEVVTGIELLSTKGLMLAKDKHGSDFLDKLIKLNEQNEFGLFITFNSSHPIGSEEALLGPVMRALMGPVKNIEQIKFDNNDCIKVDSDSKPYDLIFYLSDSELVLLDKVRHAVPYSSRELARRMGGVTESTDINIRVNSNDESERSKAYDSLASVYAKYLSGFVTEDGFDAVVYGHMHPGYGIGGGIDPHIRVIFELSNPGSRYNAPEQVTGIKKRKSSFERSILALNGKNGIAINVPEKSCFGSVEYWNWLCLGNREFADKRLELVEKYGTSSAKKELFSFRVPRRTPKYLNPPSDYIQLFSSRSAISLCRAPSKSASTQKINLALHALLHERFKLSDDQYTFILEDSADINEILKTNNISCSVVELSFDQALRGEASDGAKIYSIVCKNLPYAESSKILVISTDNIKSSKSTCPVGSILSMWQMWPYFNSEYSATICAVAICKFLLDEKTPKDSKEQKSIKSQAVYAGVTPAKFTDQIEQDFSSDAANNSETNASDKIKNIIGIPSDYSVNFLGSIRQAVLTIAKQCALKSKQVKVTIIHGDPYADTILEIFKSQNVDVSAIRIPWTTAENSQLTYVTNKLVDIFTASRIGNADSSSKPVSHLVLMVPHKSTTTADVHPDHLVKALSEKDLLMGRDYHLVCDLSSSAGARHYSKLLSPDTGRFRISFTGVLGSFHGAFGLPVGCCFMSLSPAIVEMLEMGQVLSKCSVNHSNYNRWLSSFVKNEYLPTNEKEQECYKKFRLVLGWLEKHQDLICLVPNSVDQSPALLGIFSQAKNLSVARRLLRDMFGHVVDPGYGSFEKESIRIYLANITEEELLRLLSCLDIVLELPDVILTRGENIPNIALREPHDPLVVIERLSQNLTVDDLIRNQPALAWLSRLIKTFNSNVDDLTQVPIDGEHASGEYKMKARIYAAGVNLREMQKILNLRDAETKLDIVFHYELFRDVERHIRRRVMTDTNAVWGDDGNSAAIKVLLNNAKEHLTQLAHLLGKFVKGEDPSCKASFDDEGRVRWPIVA